MEATKPNDIEIARLFFSDMLCNNWESCETRLKDKTK